MYAIKMNPDKSLSTTISATIYQYEKNADTLVFLLPTRYEEKNLSECTVYLRYILPGGIGKSEELAMCPEPYRNYYQYRLKVASALTDVPGKIELWLAITDTHDNLLLKTGTLFLTVQPTKDISKYLSPDDRNQLDKLSEKISYLERKKADNMIFDSEKQSLQLTAEGVPIGDQITLPGSDEIIVFDDTDEEADPDGESSDKIIYF